jgi:hypothetical protein
MPWAFGKGGGVVSGGTLPLEVENGLRHALRRKERTVPDKLILRLTKTRENISKLQNVLQCLFVFHRARGC